MTFPARNQQRIKTGCYLLVLFCNLATSPPLQANEAPEALRQALKQFYLQRFANLSDADYADGVYALDADARASWLAIEEFPPYEPAIDNGEQAFKQAFKDGGHYADCFRHQGIAIAQTYPQWDSEKQQLRTLAAAINECRIKHGEPALPYKSGKITELLAYMASTSRGKPIHVVIPKQQPGAKLAFEQGKQYYYQRRGQLNFSCATCHIQNAGKYIRSELLSPMRGQTSHWPTYRLKWGEMGTLHRRIIGCHKQIRAQAPEAQSHELQSLEYFMSYISNGIPFNGPGTRK